MPVVTKQGLPLTAILEPDGDRLFAYCSELDLATDATDADSALEALAELALEYAEDYAAQHEVFYRDISRASHWPYLKLILDHRDDPGFVRRLFGS